MIGTACSSTIKRRHTPDMRCCWSSAAAKPVRRTSVLHRLAKLPIQAAATCTPATWTGTLLGPDSTAIAWLSATADLAFVPRHTSRALNQPCSCCSARKTSTTAAGAQTGTLSASSSTAPRCLPRPPPCRGAAPSGCRHRHNSRAPTARPDARPSRDQTSCSLATAHGMRPPSTFNGSCPLVPAAPP